MSYDVYKILHLVFAVLFVASTVSLLHEAKGKKICKVFNGIFAFLIFVAGMGLIARIGISHTEPWPTWIKLKILLWLMVTVVSAIGVKRFSHHRYKVLGIFLTLMTLTIMTAVLGPLI